MHITVTYEVSLKYRCLGLTADLLSLLDILGMFLV